MPSLMWLFLSPFLASLAVLVLPVSGRILKRSAVVLSLIPLAFLLYGHSHWLGTQLNIPWLPRLSIYFHISVDSLSLLFLYLTAIVVPISILSVRTQSVVKPHFFLALILIVQGFLIGLFTARDLVLFTLFYEAILIPLYFIITLWGGEHRFQAALKFILYMIAGSTLMIAGVLALYFLGPHSFNMDDLTHLPSSTPYLTLIGAIFLLAFTVKTPLFPFHAWLPDAYYQAPTAGTILLAGLLSKAGIYGILRVLMELFPGFVREWSPMLLGLAIAGVLYGACAAWMQNDFKRLIAYSSFSHVNFILVGLFVVEQVAHTGAILQSFNHGITITALFLVAGWLQERIHSTRIGQYSGLAKFLPHLCWLTLFFVLSSIALPGTNNFVGELLILYGLLNYSLWLTLILGLSIIFSVVYMLHWMQKTYFEEPGAFHEEGFDIGAKEFVTAIPLIMLVLWIGIYPAPFLRQSQAASEKIESSGSQELRP